MKICQGMIWVILLNIWYIFLQEEKFSASISSTIAVFIFFVFLIQTPIKYMLEPLYPGFLNWFLPEFLNCSSVLFSCSLVSDSLRPHELQHSRLPVHHQLLEFTQTHIHWVSDAIQSSHSLSSPSPPALNLSQHQGLFKWVSSLHQMAKVLEFQRQHQSFRWTPRTNLL